MSNGNLLLEKSGGGDLQPVGFVVLYNHDEPAVCSNFVAKMELAEGMVPSYWRYCHAAAYSVRLNYRSIKQTSGIQNLDQSQYLDERAPFPPEDEQKAISSFLDVETSKIDGLVSEQRRLTQLLAEKRQAVISHAVTKGLNPNAPLKPSGIQWLGDVPQHWEVSRLKHATSRIVDCPHDTPTYNDDGDFLAIRTSDLDDGKLFPEIMKRVDEYEYHHRIRREPVLQNDIVYSREGGRWGHAALVTANDRFCLGQRMMQFRANAKFDARFLMWHLNSKNVYRQGDVDTVGAASPHVNVGTICNYRITKPPTSEQQEISDYLGERLGEFDSLEAEAERAIELLQERRTALISAAVTGKIDVRGFASEEAMA
ncbi:restriction endonuclease subunit S [Rosistilla ulvae]|uniref:restriction endonuclease subunit S n=1 Tax=Rosistilla ulvae TaxID=1930277 RepID=UPI001C54FCE1|nr:restriction endonuclease subunit S [Rosistilla ulvae]